MATVTYAYTVNQSVYEVDPSFGVRHAVVKEVNISIDNIGADIEYTIAYLSVGPGTVVVKENTLYGDLDSALAAYKQIILASE